MFQMDICTLIGLQVSHLHSHAPLFILPFCILGKTEGKLEMVRSILAQLEYRYQILLWTSKGVPFRWHVYVPEVHPITGEAFHEREDEGQVVVPVTLRPCTL